LWPVTSVLVTSVLVTSVLVTSVLVTSVLVTSVQPSPKHVYICFKLDTKQWAYMSFQQLITGCPENNQCV